MERVANIAENTAAMGSEHRAFRGAKLVRLDEQCTCVRDGSCKKIHSGNVILTGLDVSHAAASIRQQRSVPGRQARYLTSDLRHIRSIGERPFRRNGLQIPFLSLRKKMANYATVPPAFLDPGSPRSSVTSSPKPINRKAKPRPRLGTAHFRRSHRPREHLFDPAATYYVVLPVPWRARDPAASAPEKRIFRSSRTAPSQLRFLAVHGQPTLPAKQRSK